MERYSQDTFPKNLNFEQRCSGACRMLFQDTFPRYPNFKSRCPRKCFSGYVHFTECCLEKLLPKVQANSREIQNMVILDRVIGRRLGERTTVGRKLLETFMVGRWKTVLTRGPVCGVCIRMMGSEFSCRAGQTCYNYCYILLGLVGAFSRQFIISS